MWSLFSRDSRGPYLRNMNISPGKLHTGPCWKVLKAKPTVSHLAWKAGYPLKKTSMCFCPTPEKPVLNHATKIQGYNGNKRPHTNSKDQDHSKSEDRQGLEFLHICLQITLCDWLWLGQWYEPILDRECQHQYGIPMFSSGPMLTVDQGFQGPRDNGATCLGPQWEVLSLPGWCQPWNVNICTDTSLVSTNWESETAVSLECPPVPILTPLTTC